MPATLLSTSSGGVQRPSRNLFDLRLGTHLLLGGLISFFIGTIICLSFCSITPTRGRRVHKRLGYSQMMSE